MGSRFGDELREKRRSLGLSIQQVSNIVKIRPQIVEYFELGDFASMPPRGYAQGMISSYARFLGLNPRDIVNQYLDELYVFERSGEGASPRFQDPASFVSSRSDASSGRFMIVDGGAPSSSRYAQRPPQAGYVSDSTTGHSSLRVGSNPRRRQALLADASAREQDQRQGTAGQEGRPHPQRRSSTRPSGSRNRRAQGSSGRRLPEGGRARQGQYQPGRSNRGSLPPSRRGGGYGRSRAAVPQRRGQGRGRSSSASFLSSMDPRVFWAGCGIILLLIVLLIVGAVRGCTSSSTQTATVSQLAGSASTSSTKSSSSSKSSSSTKTSSSSAASDDADSTDDSTASDSTDSSDADTASDASSSDSQTTVRSTTVKISLAKGKTSWIEVKVDGVSQYADTPVGPYEAEYTPTKSISITVDNPSAVAVTENGSKVRWDSKTSGVGRVTIAVPQQTSDSSSDSTTDSSSDGSSDDSSSDDSSSDSADDQGDSSTE